MATSALDERRNPDDSIGIAPSDLSPDLAATVLTTQRTSTVDEDASTNSNDSDSDAVPLPKDRFSGPSLFPTVADAEEDDEAASKAGFECHICLDIAKDAVVSMCGHLFCWPCIHQWIETRPNVQLCPVCKALISRDRVVPLYGRGGNAEQKDPRTKAFPPRPHGRRAEPASPNLGPGAFAGLPGMFFGDGGSHLSFGIGAFPFTFFASAFNLNDGRPAAPARGTTQAVEERFLSYVFVVVAVLFAIWLVLI